jgi:hypothetical protein
MGSMKMKRGECLFIYLDIFVSNLHHDRKRGRGRPPGSKNRPKLEKLEKIAESIESVRRSNRCHQHLLSDDEEDQNRASDISHAILISPKKIWQRKAQGEKPQMVSSKKVGQRKSQGGKPRVVTFQLPTSPSVDQTSARYNSPEWDDAPTPTTPTTQTREFVTRDNLTRAEKDRKELKSIADSILLTSSEIVRLIPTDGTQSQVCPSSRGRLVVMNLSFVFRTILSKPLNNGDMILSG